MARTGDIVAVSGLKNITTGETLCDQTNPVILERMEVCLTARAHGMGLSGQRARLHAAITQIRQPASPSLAACTAPVHRYGGYVHSHLLFVVQLQRYATAADGAAAVQFPDPVIKIAIEPKTKSDQQKMTDGLLKLAQEDPSFHFSRDDETNQTVIEGMGELHLVRPAADRAQYTAPHS